MSAENINQKPSDKKNERTPINNQLLKEVITRNAGEVEKLLDAKADIRTIDDNGYPILHIAAYHGHVEMVSLLITYRMWRQENPPTSVWQALVGSTPMVDDLDTHRQTALHLAVKGGHEIVVGLLLSHKVDIDARNRSMRSALHIAAETGNTKLVELLLRAKAKINDQDNMGMTALDLAAIKGDMPVVRKLIEYKADVNTFSPQKRTTPLHLAVSNNHIEIAKTLLEAKSIIPQGKLISPPLIEAIIRNQIEIVPALLRAKADVNEWHEHKTPLHLAVLSGNNELVTTLLEAKAELEMTID